VAAAAVAAPLVAAEPAVERAVERAPERVSEPAAPAHEAYAPAPQWQSESIPDRAAVRETAHVSEVPAAHPPAPKADLDVALRDSGLVLIETKAERVQAVATDVEEQPVTRHRRERRPPPADLSAPLMQVETRDKGEGDAPPPQ
jgi:hypothetical protein